MREIATINSTSGVVPPEGLRPPQGLNAAMEGLAREVLLKGPTDIFTFAADYFEKLISMREQFTFDGRPTDIAHLVSANLNNKGNTDGINSIGKVPVAKENDKLKTQKNNLSKSQEKNDFPEKRQNDRLKSISLDSHLISNNGKITYPVEKRIKIIRIPSYPKSLESEFEKDLTRELIEMESKENIKNMSPGRESLTEVIQQSDDDGTSEETGEKSENNVAESTDDVKKEVSIDEQEPDQGCQPEHELTDVIKVNDDFIKEESAEKGDNTGKGDGDIKNSSGEGVSEAISNKQDLEVIKINDDFMKAESVEKFGNTEESGGDVKNGPEEEVAEIIENKKDLNQSAEVENEDIESMVYMENAMEKHEAETLEDTQEVAKSDIVENIGDEFKVHVEKEIEINNLETLKVAQEPTTIDGAENKVDAENGLEKEDAETLENEQEQKQIVGADIIDAECKVHVEDGLEKDDVEILEDTQELTKHVDAVNEEAMLEKGDAETLQDTQDSTQSDKAGDDDTEIKDDMKEEDKEAKEGEKISDLNVCLDQTESIKSDDDIKEESIENLIKEDVESETELIVNGVTEPHKEKNVSIIDETKTLLQEENKTSEINLNTDENNKDDTIHEKSLTITTEPLSTDANLKEITQSFIHHEKLLADNLVPTKHDDESDTVKISNEDHESNQDNNVFFKAITNAANTLLSSQKISIEIQEDVVDTLDENDKNGSNSGNTSTLIEDIISINNLEKNDIIQMMHASVDDSSDKVPVRGKRSISIQEYDPEIGTGNRSSFTDIADNEPDSLKTDTEDDDVFIPRADASIIDEIEIVKILPGDDTNLINETHKESALPVLIDENLILDVLNPASEDDILPDDVALNSEVNIPDENLNVSREILIEENKNQDERNASDVDVISEIEKGTEHFTNEESDMTQNAVEKHKIEKIENSEKESEDEVHIPEQGASPKGSENPIHSVEENAHVDQDNMERVKNELVNDPESIEIKAESGEGQTFTNTTNGTLDLITELSTKDSEHIETETVIADTVQDQIHNLEYAYPMNLEVRSMSENKEDNKNSSTETSETNVPPEDVHIPNVIAVGKEEEESKDLVPLIEDTGIITDTNLIETSKHENQNNDTVANLIEETLENKIELAVGNELLKAITDPEKEQNESPYFSDGSNTLEKASILIQKVYRGFRVHKNLPKPLVKEDESQISAALPKKKDEELFGESNEHDKEEINDIPKSLMRTISYQAAMDNKLYTVSEERNSYSTEEESSTFSSAATKIQAGVRGFLTRKYFRNKTGNSSDTTAPSIGEDSRSLDEVGNSGEPNADDTVNQMIVATSSILLEQLEHFENLEQGVENKTIPDINLIESNKESVEFIGRSNQNRKRLRREDAIQLQSPYSSGETPNNIRQASKASEDEEPIGDLAQSIITEIVSNTYTPVVQIKQNIRSPQLTPLSEPLNSRESDDEKAVDSKNTKSDEEKTNHFNAEKDVHNTTNDLKDDSKSENTIEIPELNLHSDDDDEESQATTISPDLGIVEKNIINESVVKEDRVRNALPRYISTDVETLVSKHFKENMEDIKDKVEDLTSPTSISGTETEKEHKKTDVLDSVEPTVEENYKHSSITSAEKVDLNKFSAILHSGEFHDTIVLPTKVERKLSIQKDE